MPLLRCGDRARTAVVCTLWLHVLILLGGPFLHHDFACHQKSRTHCTACTSTPSASRAESPDPLGSWRLPDAGRLGRPRVLAVDTLLQVRTTGRSPPA